MAKTATGKTSDAFWGFEIERMLPNRFLRNALFVVVVIWGVAVVLAALLFNIYLLTPEEKTFLTPARVEDLVSFMKISAPLIFTALSFAIGYLIGARRNWKGKRKFSEKSENFTP